jgi:hypothetical protein
MTELFDVIELVHDIPEHGLLAGTQGTIVESHGNNAYEAEFVNEQGETLALLALRSEQFAIVWRARTRTWAPLSEQIARIVADLPETAGHEVLDFARFLRERQQRASAHSVASTTLAGQLVSAS